MSMAISSTFYKETVTIQCCFALQRSHSRIFAFVIRLHIFHCLKSCDDLCAAEC